MKKLMRSILLLLVIALLTAVNSHAAVTGTVLGDDAKGLAGARIRVYPREASNDFYARMLSETPERAPLSTTETKSDGTFSADTKSASFVDVVVDAPGRHLIQLRSPDGEDIGALILNTAPMRTGHVTANGKPVAGARIACGRALVVKSDDKGEFQVPELSAFERIVVIHPEYAITERGASEPSIDFALVTGSQIRGRVSGTDGQAVAHATITVNGWPLAQSGDDGSFVVAHAPEKWRMVIARLGDRAAMVMNRSVASYEVRLRPAATLTGNVRNTKDGSTVAGALLVLTRGQDGSSAISCVSDAKGRFTIDGLPAGEVAVEIEHPAFAIRSVRLQLAEGMVLTRTMAATPLARLSGRVVGEDKKAIAGAHVGLPAVPRLSTVTNAAGNFTVRIASSAGPMGPMMGAPARLAEVLVSKDGYATTRYGPVAIAAGELKSGVTIVLPTGFPLELKTIDRDNKPVAGAAVSLQRWNDNAGASKSTVTCRENDRVHCRGTDVDGLMHFQLSEGKYDLQLTGDTVVTKRTTVSLNGRSSPLVVTLDRGVEISGRVVYTDGSPVNAPGLNVRSESGVTSVQSDGTFVIRNAAAGSKASLVAELLGNRGNPPVQSASKQVTAPASGVVLTLPRNGTVEGRVVDKASHGALRAFQLMVITPGSPRRSPPSAINSDDGSFSLDVEPGSYDLVADAPGYVRAISSGVKIEEGKTTNGIELQLEQGGKVTGRVMSNGQPVAEASVVVQRSSDARLMIGMIPGGVDATTSDANGEFTIDGVSAGDHMLAVNKPDYLRKEKSAEVTSGRETHVDIELDRGLELHGRVMDHDGHPLSDVRVGAHEGGRPMMDMLAVTDVDGSFRIGGLSDTHYTVSADKSGYVRGSVDNVAPQSSDLTITLQQGGSISGRVVGVSDADLPNVFVAAGGNAFNSRTEVDSAGNFTLQGVPDGMVSVSAFKRPSTRGGPPKVVEVTNGSAPPIELTFDDSNMIRGRVTRGGVPVSAGSIMFFPTTPEGHVAAAPIQGGTYEASGVSPADYNVTVHVGPSQYNVVYSEKHSVRAGETYDVDVHGSTVRGHVIDDATGAQLSEAAVWLEASGAGPREGPTDSDGKFSIESVNDGKYVLRTQKGRYAPDRQDVVVNGGDQDVEVRLRPAPRTTLRITDARDNRGIGAMVSVMDAEHKPLSREATAADGTVSLWLAPGTYSASVWSLGHVNRAITINVPGPDVPVALDPAGRLVITAQTTARVRLMIVPAVPTGNRVDTVIAVDPGNSFPFETLAPGDYIVELLGEGQTIAKKFPVTVTAGETTMLTVQ